VYGTQPGQGVRGPTLHNASTQMDNYYYKIQNEFPKRQMKTEKFLKRIAAYERCYEEIMG
jgi:hypothetical protein